MQVSRADFGGYTYQIEPPVDVGGDSLPVSLSRLAAIAVTGLGRPHLLSANESQLTTVLTHINALNVGPEIIAQELTNTINATGRTGVRHSVRVV